MNILEIIVGTLILLLVGLLVTGVVINVNDLENFKQACVQVNGKPVYNGRYWECFQ